MHHYNFFTLSYTLLLIFIASCNGQVKSNLPNSTPAIDTLKSGPIFRKEGLDFSNQLSEYIVSAYEDSKGSLWFGTVSDGAIRYSNKKLTYLSTKDGLCDNTVVSILEDKKGNMWFGTHNGIARYDGSKFTNYKIQGGGAKIFIDSKENIWVGTDRGAFRFDGKSFVTFPIPKPILEKQTHKVASGKVWSIIEDKHHDIWFGIDGFGACKFDGKSFTHLTTKDGLSSNNISKIVEDKKGNIWIGCLSSDFPKETKDGGLCKYDGKKITKFPEKKGLYNNDIYSIYCDRKGNIWVGATGHAVYRFNGKSYDTFIGTDRMDLTWSYGVQSILEDQKGNIWFGFSGGLFKFNNGRITNVTKSELEK
jgi:ligand-binding sensor domain-containing protein